MNLKGAKLVIGLFSAFWSLFLTFKVLEHISATELMWFVYWIAIPLAITMGVLHAIIEDK